MEIRAFCPTATICHVLLLINQTTTNPGGIDTLARSSTTAHQIHCRYIKEIPVFEFSNTHKWSNRYYNKRFCKRIEWLLVRGGGGGGAISIMIVGPPKKYFYKTFLQHVQCIYTNKNFNRIKIIPFQKFNNLNIYNAARTDRIY